MRGDGRLLDEKIKLGHRGQELKKNGRTFWVGVSERQTPNHSLASLKRLWTVSQLSACNYQLSPERVIAQAWGQIWGQIRKDSNKNMKYQQFTWIKWRRDRDVMTIHFFALFPYIIGYFF